MGPNLDRIIENYWKRQRIVSKAGKCLGTDFCTGRGVTQGEFSSPTIFNIVVDAVVWEVLEAVCSPHEAQYGMGWATGEINLVLYVDERRISVQDHEWVQDALTVIVDMFRRMGLEANIEKIKVMLSTPGFIWGKWGETAYKRRTTGEG